MLICEKRTIEYPTRNVAYSNHGLWIEQAAVSEQNGFECAVYYEPYENSFYSETFDVIYIDIIYCGNGIFRLNGYAVRPDTARSELRLGEWCDSYQQAKDNAFIWLREAKRFVSDKEQPKFQIACLIN